MRGEQRDETEVTRVFGKLDDGSTASVQISPDGTPGANPAFDVTPARLITGLITERGIAETSREGLLALFPDRAFASADIAYYNRATAAEFDRIGGTR